MSKLSNAPVALVAQEVVGRLQQSGSGLGDWNFTRATEQKQDHISKSFRFKDFHMAWSFMSRCVPYINSVDHHPEWFNVYNRVDVVLTTHDAKGVSEKDLRLAAEMQRIEKEVKGEVKVQQQ
jgi:4a-hydroxytetrahydrobiopterin dehydratase